MLCDGLVMALLMALLMMGRAAIAACRTRWRRWRRLLLLLLLLFARPDKVGVLVEKCDLTRFVDLGLSDTGKAVGHHDCQDHFSMQFGNALHGKCPNDKRARETVDLRL